MMPGKDLQQTLSEMTPARKAELFDALFNMDRIRFIGSANIGECGHQHLGLELWDKFPAEDVSQQGKVSLLRMLEAIADYDPAKQPCECTARDREIGQVCRVCYNKLDKTQLIQALLHTQTALALHRDGEAIPQGSLEEFKYQVVDKALKRAQPDG